LVIYFIAQYKREQEQENRDNYNSTMLYMIAQPTRKDPASLPMYQPLYCDVRAQTAQREEMSGDDILMALINNN